MDECLNDGGVVEVLISLLFIFFSWEHFVPLSWCGSRLDGSSMVYRDLFALLSQNDAKPEL